MRKRVALLVAAVVISVVGSMTPSKAMVCYHDSDIDFRPACAIGARVICGVVAKGKPCLG